MDGARRFFDRLFRRDANVEALLVANRKLTATLGDVYAENCVLVATIQSLQKQLGAKAREVDVQEQELRRYREAFGGFVGNA